MDYFLDKPLRLRGYALHRLVEQHQQGQPALWADEGRQLRIRPRHQLAPDFETGKLLAFTVRACVAFSSGNRHKYLPLADWRGRRAWLEKRAPECGFILVAVHVSPAMQRVETHDGRAFSVDATEFTGLLRVTDLPKFQHCYQHGLGKVGKAFGLNMLITD